MKFEYETLNLPFKIKFPKDFEEWTRENLPAAVIYNRFKKIMRCTRCGCIEEYGEYGVTIRKEDRVYCSCCREEQTAMPHTTPQFYSEMETVFFWKTKTAIYWAEVWAYWIHNKGEFPEDETVRIIPLSAGRISRETQTGYQRTTNYTRNGWATRFEPQKEPHLAGSAYNNQTPRVLRPHYGWHLYPGTEKLLSNTFLGVKTFENIRHPSLLIKEITLHAKYPSAEYLAKSGLQSYIDNTIYSGGKTYIRPNWKARTVHGFLRLKAQDVDKLKAWDKFDVESIAYYRKILQYRKKPQLEDLTLVSKWIEAGYLYGGKCKEDPVKLARYFNRQYTKCSYSSQTILIHEFSDYRRMSAELGYPQDDDYYRYPKNIKEAHDAITAEYVAKQEEKRIAAEKKRKIAEEKEEKAFQKDLLPKLQRYDMQDDKYLIRALVSRMEFVEEGIHNHNCVGTYAKRAFAGDAKIFVLRRVDSPDKSFVTIELAKNEKSIIQCYGRGNTIPDDDVRIWVDKWLKNIVMKKRKSAAKNAANEGRNQTLCPAM